MNIWVHKIKKCPLRKQRREKLQREWVTALRDGEKVLGWKGESREELRK
jgi:hypothetical protein